MARPEPQLVTWTDHALVKAELFQVPRVDVEECALVHHDERTVNTGAAARRLIVGRLVIAYDTQMAMIG